MPFRAVAQESSQEKACAGESERNAPRMACFIIMMRTPQTEGNEWALKFGQIFGGAGPSSRRTGPARGRVGAPLSGFLTTCDRIT